MAKKIKKVTTRKTPKAVKKATAKKAPAVKKVVKNAAVKSVEAKPKRKPNAAFMVGLIPSSALAEVVGNAPIPRTEIIKKIWEYIRKNNLQDTVNKRMINTDTKLRGIFDGKDQVSMFDLAKAVN